MEANKSVQMHLHKVFYLSNNRVNYKSILNMSATIIKFRNVLHDILANAFKKIRNSICSFEFLRLLYWQWKIFYVILNILHNIIKNFPEKYKSGTS